VANGDGGPADAGDANANGNGPNGGCARDDGVPLVWIIVSDNKSWNLGLAIRFVTASRDQSSDLIANPRLSPSLPFDSEFMSKFGSTFPDSCAVSRGFRTERMRFQTWRENLTQTDA
jgi:hypothetical protein